MGYGAKAHELIGVIIRQFAQRDQWQIKPEWTVFLPGITRDLYLSVPAFTAVQNATLPPSPISPAFYKASEQAGHTHREAPLKRETDRWVIDFEALSARRQGNETLLIRCNPHRPSSTVYRREELAQQRAFARRQTGWCVLMIFTVR